VESLTYTASEVVGKGWVEPRAQPCPKADEWCGRGATSQRNRIAKACRVWISAEDVAVAERRWCAVEANEGGENSACAACAANSSLRGKPEDATARERACKKEYPTVKWRT
jgi:hypothetical protein